MTFTRGTKVIYVMMKQATIPCRMVVDDQFKVFFASETKVFLVFSALRAFSITFLSLFDMAQVFSIIQINYSRTEM